MLLFTMFICDWPTCFCNTASLHTAIPSITLTWVNGSILQYFVLLGDLDSAMIYFSVHDLLLYPHISFVNAEKEGNPSFETLKDSLPLWCCRCDHYIIIAYSFELLSCNTLLPLWCHFEDVWCFSRSAHYSAEILCAAVDPAPSTIHLRLWPVSVIVLTSWQCSCDPHSFTYHRPSNLPNLVLSGR